MDEKLTQVLHKVELLCEQNPEFRQELCRRMGMGTSPSAVHTTQNSTTTDENIAKIERYLGLDFKLDSILPVDTIYDSIDYSFIQITAVRDKLNSDFREMMRYRFGTRLHKVDFYEYCKYAHYQLEALANEFLTSWSLREDTEEDVVDIEIAKKFILDNWPTWLKNIPNFSEKTRTIQSIEYYSKIVAIINYFNIDKITVSREPHILYSLSDVINNIRNTRNDISHRSTQQTEQIEKAINNFEKNPRIGQNDLYIMEEIKVKDYLWRRRTPFDDVVKVISILCNSIKSQLQ